MRTQRGTKDVDAIFTYGSGNKYSGINAFQVNHPSHKTVTVAAPDDVSAIVAAADFWGVRWQDYEVYSYCRVFPV